jgi:DNA-binding transcriptional MerR regulator
MTELFSLSELAKEWSDVNTQDPISPRTLRYYITQGLLEGPGRVGPGKHYKKYHLEKIKAIRLLQQNGHTIEEIRVLLGELSADKISTIICEQERVLKMRAETELKMRNLSVSDASSAEISKDMPTSELTQQYLGLKGINSFFKRRGLHNQTQLGNTDWIKVPIDPGLEVLIHETFARQHENEIRKWIDIGMASLSEQNSSIKTGKTITKEN